MKQKEQNSSAIQAERKQYQNPFPGLRPFAIEESHLFFGREGQTDEVLDKLSRNRFVSVIGPSGSGKSSFVYCGVLPILYGGFLAERGPDWEVIVTRPGNAPVDNLAQAILGKDINYLVADPEEKQIKEKITSTLINSSSLGLVEAIEQIKGQSNRNYLVLVDQFEELFRFKQEGDRDEALNRTLAFVNMLMEAVKHEGSPIYVAITMRSDFIGECAQFPELTRKINDSHYLIPQLTREQKRKAIEGPAAVAGADITPRLVQQLLNDLGDNPDQLPILQHSLMRTFDYWSRYRDGEEPIDLKHYEAIGTMRQALSLHANEAYDELNDEQKHICEVMFKAITEKRGEVFGIRRPTPLREIAAIAEVKWQEVAKVIEKFREPGRSLLIPPHGIRLKPDHVIDISHESLMRIWVRLKNWVDEEADAVQMYLRLAEAAEMYQVGKSALWRPPDLQLALNWKSKHKPTLVWGQRYNPAFERTMVFLQYSEKEWEEEQRIKELQAKRALRNARITTLVVSSALVVSIGFLLYAFAERQRAEAEAIRANNAAQEALINQYQANMTANFAKIQSSLSRLEKEEADKQTQIAEENFLAAMQARDDAEENRLQAVANEIQARQNAEEADRQAQIAQNNANEAARNADRANLEANKANRERHLSLAKALALKAKERQADLTLNGLLAQQAYNFNQEFSGEEFNADLYSGLYEGIKYQGEESGNYHPLIRPLTGHRKQVNAIASSIEGDAVYSGDSEGKILKWTSDGEIWRSTTLYNNNDAQIQTMSQTRDGKWLAAGIYFRESLQSHILLFDLEQSRPVPRELGGFRRGDVKFQVIMSPDDEDLYVLENLGQSILRIPVQGTGRTEVVSTRDEINYIAISPDGHYLGGGTESGKVLIWDRTNNYAQQEFTSPIPDEIWSLGWSVDGKYLATGDEEGWTRLYNASNGALLFQFPQQTARISDIEFSPDGNYMATASFDATVKMWNLDKLNESPKNMSDHADNVLSIGFTPDSRQIFAGSNEREIKVWPTSIQLMSDIICGIVDRNFSEEEWDRLVDEDLDWEPTCEGLPKGSSGVSSK